MYFREGYSLDRISGLFFLSFFSQSFNKKKKKSNCSFSVSTGIFLPQRCQQSPGGLRCWWRGAAERSRYRSAPSAGAWGKTPVHLCLPLPPWQPAPNDFWWLTSTSDAAFMLGRVAIFSPWYHLTSFLSYAAVQASSSVIEVCCGDRVSAC